MADRFIEIKVEDETDIILGLERLQEKQQRKLREMLVELSNVASLSLISNVPQYNSYIMNHISREGPRWMPGGAGGGGEWKSIVGIKEGTSRHPLYVEFGTGLYAGKGLIFAKGVRRLTGKRQPVMVLEKEGTVNFRYWTGGQRGQHYFHDTWEMVRDYARARMLVQDLYN